MIDRLDELLPLFSLSLYETTLMVVISLAIATIIGIPLGVLLVISRPNHLAPNKWLFHILNTIINIIRSLPFIILMLAIIPFTELIVGTTIGIRGAIVPLIVYIAPYIARLLETALLEVDYGIIEAYRGMGASRMQIVMRILIRESRPGIILCMTIAMIGINWRNCDGWCDWCRWTRRPGVTIWLPTMGSTSHVWYSYHLNCVSPNRSINRKFHREKVKENSITNLVNRSLVHLDVGPVHRVSFFSELDL